MRRIALLFFLLFSGCRPVGPDFCRPSAPLQPSWTGDAELCTPPLFWWDLLEDENLSYLVEVALEQNLALEAACFRILEARYLWKVAIGEIFPQEQVGFGSAFKEQLSRNRPNLAMGADLHFQDYQLGFQTVWELDVWGKFRRGIFAAKAQLCATVADYDDVMVLLISDVASTYVRLRTFQERIDITKRNIATQTRSLEIAKARFEAGLVTELDVQQAQFLLADTKSRLPVFEAEEVRAKNVLAVLLGIVPSAIDCYLDLQAPIPETKEAICGSIPASLLMSRPDIRRALYEARVQSERIGIAYADLFPRLSLSGTLGFESSSGTSVSGGNLLDSNSFQYRYGAEFVWPILNYGRIINRARAQDARFCQALTLYEQTVLQAYEEVESTLIFFAKRKEQAGFLKKSVKAAERAVELSNTQYVEGLADYTTVINTQQAVLQEEERYAEARAEIALSFIAAYKALGSSWQIRLCD